MVSKYRFYLLLELFSKLWSKFASQGSHLSWCLALCVGLSASCRWNNFLLVRRRPYGDNHKIE